MKEYFIIVFTITFVFNVIFSLLKEKCSNTSEDVLAHIIASIFIIALCTAGFIDYKERSVKPYKTESIYIPIVSLDYQNNTTGAFILGFGIMGSEQYYIMYRDLGNRRYKLIRRPIDEYTIRESNSLRPGIYGEKQYKVIPFRDSIIVKVMKNDIVVPLGTIVKQFKN